MPILSNYWFEDADFRGETEFFSAHHPAGGWAWINWSNTGATESTLVWEREDREIVIDLPPLLNAQDILDALDAQLRDATRTSGIRAGWIPWRHVPFYDKDPNRHGELDLLIRISFDFHVNTPWFCTAADGNINYYVVPYLDAAGRLGAYVDGWSYDYDGGWAICTGGINDKLNAAVPAGVGTLQALLNTRLSLFRDRVFDLVYLLPGSGDKSGLGKVNVNDHCSIALLPR
ncbi:MAG: hypothetical protein H7144_10970 [Burkholderiales bacterium]|nr:hypothetical protein [Phycisphaerae bacterium]